MAGPARRAGDERDERGTSGRVVWVTGAVRGGFQARSTRMHEPLAWRLKPRLRRHEASLRRLAVACPAGVSLPAVGCRRDDAGAPSDVREWAEIRQSAKADFVPFQPRFQPPGEMPGYAHPRTGPVILHILSQ
jgi:hypothetical protein